MIERRQSHRWGVFFEYPSPINYTRASSAMIIRAVRLWLIDRLFFAAAGPSIISRGGSAECSGLRKKLHASTDFHVEAKETCGNFKSCNPSSRCFPANCMLPWHRLYLRFHVVPDLHCFAWNIALQQWTGEEDEVKRRKGRERGTTKTAWHVSRSGSRFRPGELSFAWGVFW